jgi:hypothetical protein
MTDLKELLQESVHGDGPAVDPQAVLARGRRRVRQRRVRVVAAVVAGVVAAGLAVSTGLLPVRNPLPAERPGSFLRVQVPRAEALSRCQALLGRRTAMLYGYQPEQFRLLRGAGTSTTYDGTRVQNPPEPWFEGTVLYFTASGSPVGAVACMVPAKDAPDAGARPDQHARPGTEAFRSECAQAGGIDLTGWRLAASARSKDETLGLFLSANGWTLQCRYQPGSGTDLSPVDLELGAGPDVPPGPPATGPTGNRVWIGCRAFVDEYNVFEGGCFGAGAAYDSGRTVGSLRVSMPGGERTVRVHDGYYAFAFDGPAEDTTGIASRGDWSPYQQATVTSYDRDGRRIATHRVTMLTPYQSF